ncbi:MAG: putative glycosyl transferase [Planctomycetes bacterium ADurb.Bin401]|nr:MAG: putative glycosyl transferase [Planctomycetes bacterium ADurb.Bin401]
MISFVIRTYNEIAYIPKLIEMLQIQKSQDSKEIIIVDSGSTDGTLEMLNKYDVEILNIKKEDFNYSYALNEGIKNSKGEIIAILSGHSIPTNENWLKKMTTHFTDEKIAGVYCRQIPWLNADPYECLRLARTFDSKSRIFDAITGNDLMFSNAASCIRRSVWEQHPFMILPAAEDREWAQWAIKTYYKIVYDATAEVYHSHKEPCRKSAKRLIDIEKARDIHKNARRNLLLTLKQSMGLFIRDIKKAPLMDENYIKKAMLLKDCAARSFWYAYDFNRKK